MAGAEIARIPVAIVGGGRIGLVLALFLNFYGVRSILLNYCVVFDVALARGTTARMPHLSRRPLNSIRVAPRGGLAHQGQRDSIVGHLWKEVAPTVGRHVECAYQDMRRRLLPVLTQISIAELP